jgi:hypothetical protein
MSDDKLRTTLKRIRDPKRTPYDLLPNGKTLGEAANVLAVKQYAQKNKLKRERARHSRQLKREKNDKCPTSVSPSALPKETLTSVASTEPT